MPKPINISASRGAAILELSKWSTQLEVWLQIMESKYPGFIFQNNYLLPEFEYSPAMRWGHAFESAIIELAERKNENKIIDREKLFNPDPDYITCHIDGRYFNSSILHEGKTTSAFYYRDNFGEPGTDRVPVEYQIQCQHQMICTGAEKVILSVLVFPKRVEEWEEIGLEVMKFDERHLVYNLYNSKKNADAADIIDWAVILDQMGYFHQYEIPANPELQKLMIQHYTEFWEKNVIGGAVPEPKTYSDIKAICRDPIGTIIATEEIERFVSEYKNIKAEISGTGALAKRADQVKISILDYMRQHGADAIDDDSQEKFILRDRTGKRIVSYGKNKSGSFVFM